MYLAVGFIRAVLTIIVTITDKGRIRAVTGPTLELTGATFKLRTIFWFIRSISAVILSVTFPPEGNALVILTDKLAGSAVGQTCFAISRKVEVGGTGTHVTSAWGQEAQVAASAIVLIARVIRN